MIAVTCLVVALGIGAWIVSGATDDTLAAAYVPVDGDVLAEVEVAEAGPLLELPVANGTELDFKVHGHSPACQFARMDFPDDSEVVRIGSNGTVVSTVQAFCRPLFLPDGRFIATAGLHEGDLRLLLFDPTDPAAEPVELPDGLGQLHLGAGPAVVGAADEGARVLVATGDPGEDWGEALDLLDVDTGEQRRLVEPRDIGEDGARIAAAHLRGDHLVVVTAELGAVGGEIIPWVGHRMQVATEVWFGPADGELTSLRRMATLPPPEGEPGRILLPPRIVDGPGGPLVVSLEATTPVDPQWEVVVTAPDGASRVVGRVPGATEEAGATQLAIGRVGGPEGGSLDAAGTQVLIAGAVIDPDRPAEPQPVGLVLDLADGTWHRLPEPVDAAGFVTAPRG